MRKRFSKRHSSSKASIGNEKQSDVTLAEFADSRRPGIRGCLRKSKLLPEAAFHHGLEHEIPDIEISGDDDEEPELQKRKVNHRKKGAKVKEVADDGNNQYTEYPLEIWLLVAEYIRPEDILTFSLICKATWSVVNTAHFWIRLYKRYYKKSVKIPKNLSPQCLEIRRGLKSNVVRSLYYIYPPFGSKYPSIETIKGQAIVSVSIRGLQQKFNIPTFWKYNIKVCNKTRNELYNKKLDDHSINCNKEKGCSILEFFLDNYLVFPTILGSRMVSAKMIQRDLSLKMSSEPALWRPSHGGSVTEMNIRLSMPPRLIPWWHPDYGVL